MLARVASVSSACRSSAVSNAKTSTCTRSSLSRRSTTSFHKPRAFIQIRAAKYTTNTTASPEFGAANASSEKAQEHVTTENHKQKQPPSFRKYLNLRKYSFPEFPEEGIQIFSHNVAGDRTEPVILSPKVFAVPVRTDILHRVVTWQQAKIRAGTASAKTRAEVSGSGKKMWKQKKTGQARAGDKRPPHWRHGGVAFPPKPRDFSYKLQKKVRRLGVKMALTSMLAKRGLEIMDDLKLETHKTKQAVEWLKARKWYGKKLLIVDNEEFDASFQRALTSIPKVELMKQIHVNVKSVLYADRLIISREAVTALQERLLSPLHNERKLLTKPSPPVRYQSPGIQHAVERVKVAAAAASAATATSTT
jgi:large subunit ribosomal protein L4